MDKDLLRALVDLRQLYQKQRIGFGNRIGAIERGVDIPSNGSMDILTKYMTRFMDLEAETEKDILNAIKGNEIIARMQNVKGIGPLLAAKLVALIDIRVADSVSALWRYAGYGVVNGKAERPTKGEKLHYNSRLKTYLYVVGDSFLKSHSPYAEIYYSSLEYYRANRPDWTDSHCKRAARRRMLKVFLAHLWEQWRTLEGLPTRPLYAQERLGHDHYMDAQAFGWPGW